MSEPDKPRGKTGPKGIHERNILTPEQLAKVEQWAKAQQTCGRIARTIGMPEETFRANYGVFVKKNRDEGKTNVLMAQYRAATDPDGKPSDRIWWGKQHLGQTDKQEQTLRGDADAPMQVWITSPDDRREPADDAEATAPDDSD